MTTLYARQEKKDTDVYNGLLDSEGEGEGGMIWKNGIETCILSNILFWIFLDKHDLTMKSSDFVMTVF